MTKQTQPVSLEEGIAKGWKRYIARNENGAILETLGFNKQDIGECLRKARVTKIRMLSSMNCYNISPEALNAVCARPSFLSDREANAILYGVFDTYDANGIPHPFSNKTSINLTETFAARRKRNEEALLAAGFIWGDLSAGNHLKGGPLSASQAELIQKMVCHPETYTIPTLHRDLAMTGCITVNEASKLISAVHATSDGHTPFSFNMRDIHDSPTYR